MNLEMNLVSALAHILELIIVFQFFSELFNGKGKKITVFTYKPKKSSSRKMPQRVRHICFLIKHC